ncbi:MAG: hypothetical protein M3Z46_09930 [Actinomycetota bacterium]|nr:hypothetical protein [Actinomycetota bacterium]
MRRTDPRPQGPAPFAAGDRHLFSTDGAVSSGAWAEPGGIASVGGPLGAHTTAAVEADGALVVTSRLGALVCH